MAHSTGPIPNENQVSCRTLVACLVPFQPFAYALVFCTALCVEATSEG